MPAGRSPRRPKNDAAWFKVEIPVGRPPTSHEFRKILSVHRGLIWHTAKKIPGLIHVFDKSEIEAQGTLGLWHAVKNYDPSLGAFSTYAVDSIKGYFLTLFRERKLGDAVSLDSPSVSGDPESPGLKHLISAPPISRERAPREMTRAIIAALKRVRVGTAHGQRPLTPVEKKIVLLYFGFGKSSSGNRFLSKVVGVKGTRVTGTIKMVARALRIQFPELEKFIE